MRRILTFFSTLILLAAGAQISWGQTSTPTFTASDPDSQTWNNGTYSVVLVSSSGQAVPQGQAIRVDTGVTVTVSVTAQSLNGSGAGSITLVNNSNILPAGTRWKFNVCSNTLPQFCGTSTLTISSSSSISTQISASLPAPRIGGGIGAQGYADVEASAIPNNSYYNITTPACRLYTSSWGACGGGSSTLPTASVIGQSLTSTAAGTTYTAQIPLGQTTWFYPVEWYGAVGDATGATGVGTDNTTAIQACLTAVAAAGQGQCLLQAKKYRITAPLTISASSVGIAGISHGAYSTAISNQLAAHVPVSALVIDSATADAVDVAGGSLSAPVSFNKFNDFTILRTRAATGLSTNGLSISFAGGWTIDNVWSEDSTRGFYFLNAGAYGTGYFQNSGVLWGFAGFTSPTIQGFALYLDGTDSLESIRIRDSFAQTNGADTQNTVGLFLKGAQINDVMVRGFETANLSFGIYIQDTGTGQAGDIHLVDTINDTIQVAGITVTGAAIGSGAMIEIRGGWINSNAGFAKDIDIESASGVTIESVQFYGTPQYGIYVTGSNRIAIVNNNFLNANTAADVLESVVNATTIVGNTFSNGNSGSLVTDYIDWGTVIYSTITGNTFSGFATNGIVLDAASHPNSIIGTNAIDGSGTITNPITNTPGASNNVVQ